MNRVRCAECNRELVTLREACSVRGVKTLCRKCFGIAPAPPGVGGTIALLAERTSEAEAAQGGEAVA